MLKGARFSAYLLTQPFHRFKRFEPSIETAVGTIDGLNLQVSPQGAEQSLFYNGWTCSHVVSCLIIFDSDGAIVWAKINAPGSWHDSFLAWHLYSLLEEWIPEPYFVIGDSAFRSDGPRLKRPLKLNEINAATEGRKQESTALIAIRQQAEWGMRALQASNPRLKIPLPYDSLLRLTILEVAVRLHNIKARVTGINQTRTVLDDLARRERLLSALY